MKSNIRKLLPTETETIQKIATWYFDEWGTPIKKTVERLTHKLGTDTIFQLVLVIENEVIASGGLCNIVNIFKTHPKLEKYKPWVGLLYTQKNYRNAGFGTAMLNNIEQLAKADGFDKIYLYTFTAESFYRRCGWEVIDRVYYRGHHDTAVMEKIL